MDYFELEGELSTDLNFNNPEMSPEVASLNYFGEIYNASQNIC